MRKDDSDVQIVGGRARSSSCEVEGTLLRTLNPSDVDSTAVVIDLSPQSKRRAAAASSSSLAVPGRVFIDRLGVSPSPAAALHMAEPRGNRIGGVTSSIRSQGAAAPPSGGRSSTRGGGGVSARPSTASSSAATARSSTRGGGNVSARPPTASSSAATARSSTRGGGNVSARPETASSSAATARSSTRGGGNVSARPATARSSAATARSCAAGGRSSTGAGRGATTHNYGWQDRYADEYALEPVRDRGGNVLSAKCRLCTRFGRLPQAGSKRRREPDATRDHIFTSFREDNLGQHMTRCHPTEWPVYREKHAAWKKAPRERKGALWAEVEGLFLNDTLHEFFEHVPDTNILITPRIYEAAAMVFADSDTTESDSCNSAESDLANADDTFTVSEDCGASAV
eukprot:GHVU01089699.1.p1 GENE.GHVU01089699.1~~GHVU01089699.1.p1  ORF type:complete len:400 (+),score=53.01 GHVU01089699.1:191-1390(+)